MAEREGDWFDEFWERIDVSEDDGVSAARLLGELLDQGTLVRDGDRLLGGGPPTDLSPDDQFLVRRIENAANGARREVVLDA
jgi:hypothetical protein